MRKVLIVSPSFPPINAADMHRVRQTLPHLREFGWHAVALVVDPAYNEGLREDDLLRSVPSDVEVRRVRALDPRWTRKVGLGSLALRSLPFYERAGNRILEKRDVDLIYFSTTMFPVTVLGAYWKRRYGVPYVIDMQDPWYTDYYDKRPKRERPPKHWFSSRLNKYLEPIAMRSVDALISVSDDYSQTLRARYSRLDSISCTTIPFGGDEGDFDLLASLAPENRFFRQDGDRINVVYVGRGGHDMQLAARATFRALVQGLRDAPRLFERVHMYFVGTHYARFDADAKTFEPLASEYGIENRVHEYPARVPYFTALELLRQADMLFLPGSTSAGYTASKLYPYVLARRPILPVFDERSSVVSILRTVGAAEPVTFRADNSAADAALSLRVGEQWTSLLRRLPFTPATDWKAFEPYTARAMTRRQVEVFNRVIGAH